MAEAPFLTPRGPVAGGTRASPAGDEKSTVVDERGTLNTAAESSERLRGFRGALGKPGVRVCEYSR